MEWQLIWRNHSVAPRCWRPSGPRPDHRGNCNKRTPAKCSREAKQRLSFNGAAAATRRRSYLMGEQLIAPASKLGSKVVLDGELKANVVAREPVIVFEIAPQHFATY